MTLKPVLWTALGIVIGVSATATVPAMFAQVAQRPPVIVAERIPAVPVPVVECRGGVANDSNSGIGNWMNSAVVAGKRNFIVVNDQICTW